MAQYSDDLLREGIDILCNNDSEINSAVAPQKNEIISLLEKYIKEIELFNPAYRLVGTNDKRELIIKHIFDSLAPLGIISRLLKINEKSPEKTQGYTANANAVCTEKKDYNIKIADAGSGAGLPGIPLAAALTDAHFTLIERMGRRAGFLLNAKAVLSLSNISVEEKEIEKITGVFDLITFRAFKPLEPKLHGKLLKICAPDGIISAYKGKREKIEAETAWLKGTDLASEIIPYTVPFLNEERHILVIRGK